jgi:hypothetical protein
LPGDLGAPAARRPLAGLRFAREGVANVVACCPGSREARIAACKAGYKNANGATEAAPSVVQRFTAPPDYLPVGAVVGAGAAAGAAAAPEPAAGAAAAPEPEPAAGAAGGATGGASTTGGAAGAGAAAEPEPAASGAGAGADGQPASMAAEARTAAEIERRKKDIAVTSRRKVPIARRAETELRSSWYGGGC